MKVPLFCIRDSLTAFKVPFPARNEADAARMFRFAVNDGQSDVYKIRQDSQLWFVGEFDDDTGVIVSEPRLVVSGGDCIVVET